MNAPVVRGRLTAALFSASPHWRTLLLVAVPLAFVTGCVEPVVTQKASQPVDFKRFKTATYQVHPTPTTEYGSDMNYAKGTISLLDSLLGKKLADLGYATPVVGATPDLAIDVAVTAVKEGSGATRFWVGFGAGRAVLLFSATFKDATGTEITSFQGGRSYTGMEFGNTFASNDEIQTQAATRAVSQFEEFMRNGGTFPSQNEKKAR